MAGWLSGLIYILLLPACAGLFYLLFALRSPFPSFDFDAEGACVVAGLAGFFLWGGIWYFQEMRRKSVERALMKADTLKNGRRAVVSGVVEAEGPLLTAPFTGRKCLAYRYYSSRFSIRRSARASTAGTSEIRDYEGYALTPTVVRTGHGRVKILPPPDYRFFEKLPVESVGHIVENRQRADDYLQTAAHAGSARAEHRSESADETGGVRYDRKKTERPEEAFLLNEGILEPGQQVTLSGIYSSVLSGIGPDPDWFSRPFSITIGEPADLAGDIRRNRVKGMVWTALSCITAAVYYLIVLRGL